MTPALARSVPFFDYRQVFTSEEEELVAIFRDVGRRGAFILQKDLFRFEQNLAKFLGVKHVSGVANATDGLLIALRAAGIGAGDEVIFCSHTMVATAAAIHFAGAVPVPVDCGADHLIDPVAAEAAITPRTRAILPTQLNGRTADMEALGKYGLLIVEDAAQALGSKFKGRAAGTFGTAAAISFFPAKILGCLGDGGAVVTNDDAIHDRVMQLRDHGRGADGEIVSWGLNSRLDNLQAAILDHRLRKHDQAVERRRAIARRYCEALTDLEELVLPPYDDADHFDVFQNYEIEAEHRDELRAFLSSRGIGTSIPWGGKAVHQWEGLGFDARLPRTERLFQKLLLLPMHPRLSEDDVEYVAVTVREFVGRAVLPASRLSSRVSSATKASQGAGCGPGGPPHLLALQETMVRIRRAEESIAEMIERGEARGPCHLSIGQEAIAAGVCAALKTEDTIWGGHRSHGHYLAKGGSLEAMLDEIRGGRGGSMHLFAPEQGILGTVPIVAATVPLAVGAAMAYKMRGEQRVAVAFFGDGALEEGSVHESMNLAALYRLPVVFVCENNLYASHMHWSERRVADNLHRAGEFHSIPGQRVDGNDVVAVYEATQPAVDRARAGDGPTFLECRTFRWRGHVGASYDQDVGVQRRGELEEWLEKDPIRLVEKACAL